MAKKKHRKKNPGNPSYAIVKAKAKHVYHRASGFLGKHGVFETAKTAWPMLGGVLLALMFRKKFGEAASAEAKWKWKDYLMCLLGGLAGTMGARGIFHAKEHTSNLLFLGAVMLAGYKAIEEQIVPQSATLKNWIGDDDDSDEGDYSEDGVFGYLPGDRVQSESGAVSVLGDDGVWRPDEEMDGYGDDTQYPGRLGDVTSNPGHLGAWGKSPLSAVS